MPKSSANIICHHRNSSSYQRTWSISTNFNSLRRSRKVLSPPLFTFPCTSFSLSLSHTHSMSHLLFSLSLSSSSYHPCIHLSFFVLPPLSLSLSIARIETQLGRNEVSANRNRYNSGRIRGAVMSSQERE